LCVFVCVCVCVSVLFFLLSFLFCGKAGIARHNYNAGSFSFSLPPLFFLFFVLSQGRYSQSQLLKPIEKV
jgi:hypothetical protein